MIIGLVRSMMYCRFQNSVWPGNVVELDGDSVQFIYRLLVRYLAGIGLFDDVSSLSEFCMARKRC